MTNLVEALYVFKDCTFTPLQASITHNGDPIVILDCWFGVPDPDETDPDDEPPPEAA